MGSGSGSGMGSGSGSGMGSGSGSGSGMGSGSGSGGPEETPNPYEGDKDAVHCGCEVPHEWFCNYDYGTTGFCETCSDVPEGGGPHGCENWGLPAAGALDCVDKCCPGKSFDPPDNADGTKNVGCGCEVAGDWFCNYDYGTQGGFCEACADVPGGKLDGCNNWGLPPLGATDCAAQCFGETKFTWVTVDGGKTRRMAKARAGKAASILTKATTLLATSRPFDAERHKASELTLKRESQAHEHHAFNPSKHKAGEETPEQRGMRLYASDKHRAGADTASREAARVAAREATARKLRASLRAR